VSEFDSISRELEQTAERLREQDLDPDEAADLVERAAELASRVSAELEREARSTPADEPPGQETLL
jgi:exonuclease VII small subunit